MATTLKDLLESQEETNLLLDEIDTRFLAFFAMLRADKLDMLEIMSELKEQRNGVPVVPGALPPSNSQAPSSPSPLALGGLGALAIGGLTIGPALLLGFVEGVFDFLRAALKFVNLNFISTNLMTKFKNSKVFTFLDDLVARTYIMLDDFIVKPLSNFGTFVGDKFRTLKNFFDPTGVLGKIFRPITDGVQAVGGVFGRIGATFAKFFGAIRAFGQVVGRLFIPIGFILSLIDTVKGAIKGFTEEEGNFFDKMIGGLYGGLKGLINGLIMMPLDLLKDGISWIAGKLGFENFSEMLDSFSFQDLFSNMVDKIKTIVQKIFRFPIAVAKGSYAAVAAFIPGGESPIEAFGRTFSETMNKGDASQEKATTTLKSAAIAEAPPEQLSAARTRADVRREAMERNALEASAAPNNITVVNNTNAPTNVSNQTSMMNGGGDMPSATTSNGTRADAYAAA